MDTRTSYSSPSSGFRSQTYSRASPSSSSYKRTFNVPVARAYGATVLSSADSHDYTQTSILNGDYKRSNEKEQLQGLNDRFAGYIDKVHFLEQQNKQIEAEIQALRQKQVSQSQLGELYDQELQELRSMLEQIHHEKAQIQLDTEHIDEDIQRLRDRFDEEARIREETEAIVRALKKDTGDSVLVKAELEKKVQSLQDEIAFIRNNHQEEISDLMAQVQESQITVEKRDYQKADITEPCGRFARSWRATRRKTSSRWKTGSCAATPNSRRPPSKIKAPSDQHGTRSQTTAVSYSPKPSSWSLSEEPKSLWRGS